jgi:NlpC/P60 family putative phage cell wall peptidase
MTDDNERLRIVAAARRWIGTPYRHQGSRRGVGCDCLGLVRGVWREIRGEEPEEPGPYARDWAAQGGDERLIEAARRLCAGERTLRDMRPGDILVFRWRAHMPATHLGIASGPDHFIHAYEQAAVVESALVPAWRRRVAAVFSFPEVS